MIVYVLWQKDSADDRLELIAVCRSVEVAKGLVETDHPRVEWVGLDSRWTDRDDSPSRTSYRYEITGHTVL